MFSLILLAGGIGKRVGGPIPKQFIPLHGKALALHSYELFQSCPEIAEIVVVIAPQYQHIFPKATKFASPGPRRQDSVYSGLFKCSHEMILTHDSARPFVEKKYIPPLLEAALRTGAAALGEKVTNTIKQCNSDLLVEKTLDRETLWQIQTPQAIRRDLLEQAFALARAHNIEVTDELSLVELLSHPAEIVPSSPRNIKITTSFDLSIAHAL